MSRTERSSTHCLSCWKRAIPCEVAQTGHWTGCADHERLAQWIEGQSVKAQRIHRFSQLYAAALAFSGLMLVTIWLVAGR